MSFAPVVEILFFEDCPNHAGARELVERVSGELGVDSDVRMVDVETLEDVQRLRFLGSPTVRVNGHDVEPGADERQDFALACRVYRTSAGLQGQPDEAWVRDALNEARGDSLSECKGDGRIGMTPPGWATPGSASSPVS